MNTQDFRELLTAYGDSHPPSLRFEANCDIASWQATLHAKLNELRGPLPDRVEPTVTVHQSIPEDGYTRLVIEIAVNDISTLPAYLLIPDDLKDGEQRPGLLVSHGHCKYGIDGICGVEGMDEADNARRAYAQSAVRSGYVVIAPAWWGWAGRNGHLELIGARDRCNVIQMTASMYGFNVMDLHIQDAHAAIDVLTARPEVNATRIGCMGNSYGGRTCMWFTIFDDRIQACVASGCMNTFRERSLKLTSCGIQYLFGTLRYADVPDLFCLIAPRPLQLQAGKSDDLITPTDRDMIAENVAAAYRKHDRTDNLDYVLNDDAHLLLWEPAHKFLKQHLKE